MPPHLKPGCVTREADTKLPEGASGSTVPVAAAAPCSAPPSDDSKLVTTASAPAVGVWSPLALLPSNTGKWTLCLKGTRTAGPMFDPTGVAVHIGSGDVYVADGSQFLVFDRRLEHVTTFPFVPDPADEVGIGKARSLKIAVDPTGARVFHVVVWTLGTKSNALMATSLYTYRCDDGTLVHRQTGPLGHRILRIGVDPHSGDVIVVTNPLEGEPPYFHILVLKHGIFNLKRKWATNATYGPSKGVGIAVDIDTGEISIADQEKGSVSVYSPRGDLIADWSAGEPITSTLALPGGFVAVYMGDARLQIRNLRSGALVAEHKYSVPAGETALARTQSAAFNPYTSEVVFALSKAAKTGLAAVTIATQPTLLRSHAGHCTRSDISTTRSSAAACATGTSATEGCVGGAGVGGAGVEDVAGGEGAMR